MPFSSDLDIVLTGLCVAIRNFSVLLYQLEAVKKGFAHCIVRCQICFERINSILTTRQINLSIQKIQNRMMNRKIKFTKTWGLTVNVALNMNQQQITWVYD